jgi:O-antigen ligase
MSGDEVDPILAVGAIVAAVLAGAALAAPLTGRLRAGAMVLALALTPALLLAEIWDSEQIQALRDRPAVAAVAAVVGLVAVAALAVLVRRRPQWLPVALVAALPFRIPIAAGGTTSSLLVPLYAVIAAGVLAYAIPRLLGRVDDAGEPEPGGAWLRRLLALAIALYAVQASYSSDFERALQQVVFFYVPFALMTTLLVRVAWSRALALRCLGVLVALAVLFVGIGFVEYATRSLLLNPKVIASNQFETYFRVNSLFFDPNIYGRFLAIVMLLVTAVLLWATRPRVVVGCGLLLALLWGGLVLTLSQSSFAALLGGLVVLAALRWGARPAALALGAVVVVAAAAALVAPAQIGLDGDASNGTSGRSTLVEGGLGLFADAPVLGTGSASFRREYRRAENASGERATNASHTQPVTVAAEQGVVGLLVYAALVVAALLALVRGAGGAVALAGIAAAFVALQVHTMSYAAFLEDPLAWALLAAGVGLRTLAPADP